MTKRAFFIKDQIRTGQKNTEKGNAAFYALFVIPITLVLLIVVIDISAWQGLREEAQRGADILALESAQYLPYKQDVTNVLASKSQNFNSSSSANNSSLQINNSSSRTYFTSSKVQVEVIGRYESGLDALFKAFTGQEAAFPVAETAVARVLPLDVYLVLSDSINLRPSAPNLWGNPLDWPSAEYFNFINPPSINIRPAPSYPNSWPNWWTTSQFTVDKYKRFATQLCYNTVYSPLKDAALKLIDTVSASSENRLSVIMTPGDIPQSLGGIGYNKLRSFSFIDDTNARVQWSSYFEPDNAACDEACVYFGSEETNNARYKLRSNASSWSTSSSSCPDIIKDDIFIDSRGHYPNPYVSKLENCFFSTVLGSAIGLREAVYFHAVRRNSHEALAGNVARSIQVAATELIEADKLSANASLQKRGGLAKDTKKIIVVITESLPAFSNPLMIEAIRVLRASGAGKLYILAYNASDISAAVKQDLAQALLSYPTDQNDITVSLVNETNISSQITLILTNEKRIILSS